MESDQQQTSERSIEIYNLVILDESGSMESVKKETISGFNEVVQTIKSSQEEYKDQKNYITLVSFNTMGIKTVLNLVPASELNEINGQNYRPNASTPLLDAIGFSCSRLRHALSEKKDFKVLVTILTDGEENSSREYSYAAIKRLIEELRGEGWVFTFMGANIDVDEMADRISIVNKMSFKSDPEGLKEAFKLENSARMSYHRKIHENRTDLDNYYEDENLKKQPKKDKNK